MASRNILKDYFVTGAKPTQSQFWQFIDSVFNLTDDSKATIGLGSVDNTSDMDKPVSTAQAAADTVVLNSAKAYADGLVTGIYKDQGNYDPSGNTYPTAADTFPLVAQVKAGFIWTSNGNGTLNSRLVQPGDTIRALIDNPGQTDANWAVAETNIGYVPENAANKNAVNGYAGLNAGYALQLKDSTGVVNSILANLATEGRTWSLQDRNGILADDTDTSTLQTQITNLNPQVATVDSTCGEIPAKNHYLINDTPGNADFTIDPGGPAARTFFLMRTGTVPGNTVTIKAPSGGTVNGVASLPLAAAYDWMKILVPAGSNDVFAFM